MYNQNLAIFRALACLELEAYSKPCETLTRHIHNPAIVRTVYSGIIQPCSDIFRTLCNACIYRNLAYSELAYIQNPVIFMKTGQACITLEIQNPDILTILGYSEP